MSRAYLRAALAAAVVSYAGLVQAGPPEKAAAPGPADPREAAGPALASGEDAIEKALDRKVDCEFVETPLQDVAEYFRGLLKINIVLDKKALDEVGIGTDAPLTQRVSGVTFRSALELALRPLKLTWTIHDEVLMVTTPEEAQQMLVTKVYPVGDLVVREGPGWAGPGGYDFDSLMDVITTSVAPASWDQVGGPGSIAVLSSARINALVVSQTYQVHHRIVTLLEELRKVAEEKPAEKPPAEEGK